MSQKRFGKVGVLAGGPSSEREISLKSGKAVYDAIIREGVDAVLLDVEPRGFTPAAHFISGFRGTEPRTVPPTGGAGAWVKNDICDMINGQRINVAFIALHGKFGEDGTVQKILEDSHIPYTGSGAEASRLALDKIASKSVFMSSDIPVPRYVVFTKNGYLIGDADALGLPVVVKPQFEGSSIGLSVVRDKGSLKKALDLAFRCGDNVLAEEYIDGRELTVGILDDEPLPVIEIVTKTKVYDYKAKYCDPETKYLVPAPLKKSEFKKAQELARSAHLSLGCRCFSRTDMMMDKTGNIFVLEVNTIPGMTRRSLLPKAAQAKGLSFGKLCVKLIEDALRRPRTFYV